MMSGRGTQMLVLGIVIGVLAGVLAVGGLAAAWGWRAGAAAHGHDVIVLPVRAMQERVPPPNLREFIPLPFGTQPPPGQGQQPSPGTGGQNCDKILYFYQGRLYQLRPGPTPRNGGNPEFFFMQPYDGPQIPGFPAPGTPGQPLPPTLKF